MNQNNTPNPELQAKHQKLLNFLKEEKIAIVVNPSNILLEVVSTEPAPAQEDSNTIDETTDATVTADNVEQSNEEK